jgi:hypothetical protein
LYRPSDAHLETWHRVVAGEQQSVSKRPEMIQTSFLPLSVWFQ